MKSTKKVQLSSLKVNSFVTTIEKTEENTLKGGRKISTTQNTMTCTGSTWNTSTMVGNLTETC